MTRASDWRRGSGSPTCSALLRTATGTRGSSQRSRRWSITTASSVCCCGRSLTSAGATLPGERPLW
eukprot:7751406-Alexandrium_andersonii.AAC.1